MAHLAYVRPCQKKSSKLLGFALDGSPGGMVGSRDHQDQLPTGGVIYDGAQNSRATFSVTMGTKISMGLFGYDLPFASFSHLAGGPLSLYL